MEENTSAIVPETPKPERVRIMVRKSGPYRVSGDFDLVDSQGNPVPHGTQISLCRCGQSRNKPFCDGMHNKTGFFTEV